MKKERVLYLDMIRVVGFLAITAHHFAATARDYGIVSESIDSYVGIGSIVWGSIALSCFLWCPVRH